MRLVIVTGMSGAGKSTALKMLEDAGYFCVDNIPIQLIYKLVILTSTDAKEFDKIALGVDIRSGQALDELNEVLETMEEEGYDFEILFLDASTEVLVKRFKETRRTHPLAVNTRLEYGIEKEREKLEFLKKKADYKIDTSKLLVRELKAEVDQIFVLNQQYHNFFINIVSFGFKYGMPTDGDLVFDVRFLPNPYYVDNLRQLTGNDKEVKNYVMESPVAVDFSNKLEDMIQFLIPHYIAEGKNQLVICIGCTGGKHRSVTLANELYNRLRKLEYGLKVEHRDIEKDSRG
ncbi:MAG: RNase adapter RapZ [Clostridiales bacterium]|nr:RNase adapter RapZ [Clostridiales bacterium]